MAVSLFLMNSHEINIYGDIVPFKFWNDGTEYDRSDLNKAIDALDLKTGDEIIYNLHTFGGCTTTAFAMFNKLLRVKKEKNITLTSRADGYCASSGVILLLAADKRIGSSYLQPFVHNAWSWIDSSDKNEAKKAYEELVEVDGKIANLYSERTSIDKKRALELMNESRDVTLDECLEFGFYTEIENVYSAENTLIFNSLKKRNSKNRTRTKTKNMSKEALTKKEADKKFKSLDETLNGIMNFIKGKSKVSNLIVQDANGVEIDFTELEADAIPKKNDTATVDGTPASGEYVMPTGETYVFVDGSLDDIKESDEEEENEEVENLKTENDELKAENKLLKKNLKKAGKEIKNFRNEFNDLKKNVTSKFNYDPKIENKKNGKGSKNKTRQLFKEKSN